MSASTPVRRRLLVAGAAGLLVLSACSDPSTTSAAPTPTPSATSPSPSPTATTPAKAEAAALVAAGPRVFDAEYRLRSSHPGQSGATVRVRHTPRRYRVDVSHGQRTASLLSAQAGLVSCQTDPSGQSCYLVGRRAGTPPPLFDPGVQRIFVTTMPLLVGRRHAVKVARAGVWRAPAPYGSAQCYQVTGKLPDPGVYCFLLRGRWKGALARAEFGSGTLSLRHIDRHFGAATTFRPPVRPTPLPG